MQKEKRGNWGGARTPAAGKKLGVARVRLRISDEAGKKLNQVWKVRSMQEPGLTEDEIVSALIMQMAEPIEDNEVERRPSTNAPFDAYRELRPDDGEPPIII